MYKEPVVENDDFWMLSISRDWDRLDWLSDWGKKYPRVIDNVPCFSLIEAGQHFENNKFDFLFIDAPNLSPGDRFEAAKESFVKKAGDPFVGYLSGPTSKALPGAGGSSIDMLLFDDANLDSQLS